MKKLLTFMLLAFPVMLMAQEQPPAEASAYKAPISYQVTAGTQGIGGDFRYGFLNNLSARLGASFAVVNANADYSFSGFTSTSSQKVNFSNVHLLADLVPFKSMQGFRIVGGAGYLFKADGNVTVTPTGNYNFANYNLTGAEIGTLDMNVGWKGVAPYLGFGLFKAFPSNFFNFNLDLGTYYLTQPSTRIIGTNLLTDNSKLEPQFNENLKGYRWLPVLQLNFNFRIK
ncbi:hypothetical protein [Mucilaginibacter myungsuensis]|uniref:Outer membrane protein with beta-barrel domain n=1 Tax=Mucilaginibacter myungsuensis TaxID=649104 RepID=A0A929KUK4_9SPHI|nr:hypothetical protein [Mucilaginibacter myungsuensis]MBE9661052.1 hypothetical protein [Mucilaginibacter myungsuensis]MDN3597196.1 hypothetical protein [Mucilaginibacter myungsuensis]